MSEITELAHAKINLTLDVLGRRPDGYHEVNMVMQTLELADTLTLKRSDKGITLFTTTDEIPVGPENLAWKAAKLMFEHFNLDGGIEICLEKCIPVAAGLAGGSADAAAVIRGINKLCNLGQTAEQLCTLGAKIGSDVPFCILQGTAVARGRGEVLEQLAPCPHMWVVLVKPPVGVATGDVYARYSSDRVEQRPNTAGVIQAINERNGTSVARSLCNVLESVTIKLIPEIAVIKDKMVRAGAVNSLMSGSGPTVFAIANNQVEAQAIADKFDPKINTVVVTRTYNG